MGLGNKFKEVKKAYAEANKLLGDLIKVRQNKVQSSTNSTNAFSQRLFLFLYLPELNNPRLRWVHPLVCAVTLSLCG